LRAQRERRHEDVETEWRSGQISEGPEAQDAPPAADPGAPEGAPPAGAACTDAAGVTGSKSEISNLKI
jgi:hypothetical protein